MGIVTSDIERVRTETDFVAVASEHLALKKVGRRWTGLCPFHAEKTPSFSVNAEAGLFYCFGCQAKGDVISFVRELEHLDFVEAVEKLASRSGIELHYDERAAGPDRKEKEELYGLVERAVEFYHERLLSGKDAATARGYLRKRGFNADEVRAFKLGWAPDDWDALAKHLKAPAELLEKAGLGFVNRRGRKQDTFRARIMFPIFDAAGRAVAFGGRILEGAEGPKYKNSPETPIYVKRRTLYGLNWAKGKVVEDASVVVCEGYTDVMGFFRVGVTNAVATCGTALAEEHVRALKNFASRVILAYDADSAGQAAAERFYQWERQYEMDIAVAVLPPGRDPGELSMRSPDALREIVVNAQPFMAFRLDRVFGAADLRSPEGRARAAEDALVVIAEHPNELVRDQYLMNVADRCRVDVEILRPRVAGGKRPAPVQARAPRRRESGPELEALRVAVHQPEVFADVLPDVAAAESLFSDETLARAYRVLANSDTLHAALSTAEPEAAALLQRVAVEEPPEEAFDALSRFIDRAASRELVVLERSSRDEGADLEELSAITGWLRVRIDELRQEGVHAETVDQLVHWLFDRENNAEPVAS